MSALISIVIPVFNEASNIQPLYASLFRVLPPNFSYEIVFVDDGSSDESLVSLRVLSEKDQRIKVIRLTRNFGHQIALTAGLDAASGVAAISMDADLQHPADLIPEMLRIWQSGYPIVYTVRSDTHDSWTFKRWSSDLFYRLFRRWSDLRIPSRSADFRLLDRSVLDALSLTRERSRFLRGLIFWFGFRSKSISFQEAPRHSGHTRYSLFKMAKLAMDAWISFSTLPLYAAVILGLFFSLLGGAEVIYALYVRFITGKTLEGWTSTIILVSVIGGIQLLVTGMAGLYIAKIFDEVKQRPLYWIQERIGFPKNIDSTDH